MPVATGSVSVCAGRWHRVSVGAGADADRICWEITRNAVMSVYRFINGKTGKMGVFWYGTVRAFCKKSKNGTLFRTVGSVSFVWYGLRLFTKKPITVGYFVRDWSRLKTETENSVFFCYGSVNSFFWQTKTVWCLATVSRFFKFSEMVGPETVG